MTRSINGGEFSLIFGLTGPLVASYLFAPVPAILITVLFAGVIAGSCRANG